MKCRSTSGCTEKTAHRQSRMYLVGLVELVGEISDTVCSVTIDTTWKLETYEASGCKEYIIGNTLENKFV